MEDALRTLTSLVAQLIADNRNMHRDPKQTPTPFAPADFLPREPADEAEDSGEKADEVRADERLAQQDAAMIAFGATRSGDPLRQGHGNKLPSAATAAFFGQASDTQEE